MGGYRVVRQLGAGGSGQVYLVRDGDGAVAALKRVDAHDDPVAAERLRREVRALMAVRHPAVPRVLDAELDDEETFVVFEYIEGASLADYVHTHGPLEGEQLAHLAERVAGALEAAHAAGVVHRDVTPSNVMISPQGAVLIDFGLSHRTDDARLTREGLVSGTAGYVAPEVIDGEEPGADADRWSWAATLAYAATGKAPFGVGGSAIRKTLAGGWKVPADLPGGPVLAAALDKAPDARPGMRDVVAALRGATIVLPQEHLEATAVMESGTAPTAVLQAEPEVADPEQWEEIAGDDSTEWDEPREWDEPQVSDYDENGIWIGDEHGDFVLPSASEALGYDPLPTRPVLVASWWIAAAIAVALAPVIAVVVIALASLIARTVFRRAEALRIVRARRGERRRDNVLHTVGLPWHGVRAFVELLPSLATAAVIGGAVGWLGWHLVSIGALGPTSDQAVGWGHAAALAVAGLAFEAALWWGLWSWATREGTWYALTTIAPTKGVSVAWVVVALAVAASAGVALYLGAEPWWWPLPPIPQAG